MPALCSSQVLALYSPGGFVEVFADARRGLFTIVRQSGASSYSLGGSVRCLQMSGGSFYDRTVLWRAREVFADARVRAEDLFVIVRQSDASSMFL